MNYKFQLLEFPEGFRINHLHYLQAIKTTLVTELCNSYFTAKFWLISLWIVGMFEKSALSSPGGILYAFNIQILFTPLFLVPALLRLELAFWQKQLAKKKSANLSRPTTIHGCHPSSSIRIIADRHSLHHIYYGASTTTAPRVFSTWP